MKSIYDQATLHELTDRINKLTPSSQRLWGKMDVAQMMAHCAAVLEMSLSDNNPKPNFIQRFVGKTFIKPMIVNEKPFKQNMPTGAPFVVADSKEFDKEKAKLLGLVVKFSGIGADRMHNKEHSFFGPLTSKEWSNSTVKHLDHHLKQFGV